MTDPAVQAVADALMASDRFTHGDVKGVARVAVDAYRRKVLASHPDAERLELVRGWVGAGHAGPAAETTRYLLAALADADARAEQREQLRSLVQRMTSALIAVEHNLDKPYPDDPRWTPWTRFVYPAIKSLRRAVGLS